MKNNKIRLYEKANELLKKHGFDTEFRYDKRSSDVDEPRTVPIHKDKNYLNELTDNGLLDLEREKFDLKNKKLIKEITNNLNTIFGTKTKLKKVDTRRGTYYIKDYEIEEDGTGYSERIGRFVGDVCGELTFITKNGFSTYKCKCNICGYIATYKINVAKRGKCKKCNSTYGKIKIGDRIESWTILKKIKECNRSYYIVKCNKCKKKNKLTYIQTYMAKKCKCLSKKHRIVR